MRFLILFLIVLAHSSAFSQEYIYYTGIDYGSESIYNPLNLLLNASFDIIQLEGRSRNVFQFNYARNTKYLFKNLSSSLYVISQFGYWNFIKNELLPINLTKKQAQWWPNYQLHLIGGGMTYVAIEEWYTMHGFPFPKIFSLATMASYHLLNEIRENDNYDDINVDPIADIYFFDIGGIILFSFNGVKNFFKEELNLADWSLQPSFCFDGTLHNNGQYFSIKWKTPLAERLSFFYYFGMNGLIGGSYKFNEEESISAGFGLRAKKLDVFNEVGRQFELKTTWNFGVFYDKNNSLMTSIFFSGLTDYFCNINIYPGIIKIGEFSPGIWCVLQRNRNIILGLTTVYVPGLGVIFK